MNCLVVVQDLARSGTCGARGVRDAARGHLQDFEGTGQLQEVCGEVGTGERGLLMAAVVQCVTVWRVAPSPGCFHAVHVRHVVTRTSCWDKDSQ